MAKTKKTLGINNKKSNNFLANFDLEKYLPQKYHPLAVFLIIFILFLIFLNPIYFGNKTFQSGDITSSASFKTYLTQDREGFTLWNPLIFTGMPAYAIGTGAPWFNLINMGFSYLRNAYTAFFSVDYIKWTFYLLILGLTSFLLVQYLTKKSLVGLFAAISTVFSTGILVFLYIGHVTKLTSLCWFPLIFLILLRLNKKIKIIDFLILIITFQLSLQGFHVQIIFYTLLSVAIYYIYYFSYALLKKDSELKSNLVKSAGLFILAAGIAIAIQADNFTQIYEYTPYSTRGTESLSEKSAPKTAAKESDYYAYHTDWSFSPGEVLTFIIPSYYGFGNSTYKGPLTQEQEIEVNTYFGQMRFVDVAMYMGVLVFFFGLFAMFTRRKEPFVQFLIILVVFSLLVSFGRNFPIIFDFLFNYFPYFNKFRVPSMILVITQLCFPILAGLGIAKIIEIRKENSPKFFSLIKNISLLFSSIFIISILFNYPIQQWFVGRVNDYAGTIQSSNPRLAQQYQALAEYTAGMFSGDLLIAFGFSAAAFWACFFYIKGKFSPSSLALILIAFTLIDLWRIDFRSQKFVDNPDPKNYFQTPDYVNTIRAQKDKEPFRILNLKQDGSYGSINNNSNFNAYFMLEDFYGYSGIKPRAYQDIIDIVGVANITLWRMLNVKYIITDQPIQFPGLQMIDSKKEGTVYENINSLARVYFVDSIAVKKDLDVLNLMKTSSFDPKHVAYISAGNLKIDQPDSSAYIKITNYQEAKVLLDVNSSGNNFIFFGNSYVPGWKAYIDGKRTEIYQTNHGYMGIIVNQGKHNVEFVFAPTSFYISKYIALTLSALVLLTLFVILFYQYIKRNKLDLKTAK